MRMSSMSLIIELANVWLTSSPETWTTLNCYRGKRKQTEVQTMHCGIIQDSGII